MHVKVNMISLEPCLDNMVVKAKLENQCAIRHKPNDMKMARGKWQYWTFGTL